LKRSLLDVQTGARFALSDKLKLFLHKLSAWSNSIDFLLKVYVALSLRA
jgi:hypothetical protein